MDCSLPGFSVHGILQARILEWVAMPFSRGSSQPRGWTCVSYVSCIGRWVFTTIAPWEAPNIPIAFDCCPFLFSLLPLRPLTHFICATPGGGSSSLGNWGSGREVVSQSSSLRQWVWWKSQSWARSREDQSRGVLLFTEHSLFWGSQTLGVESFTDHHFIVDGRNP